MLSSEPRNAQSFVTAGAARFAPSVVDIQLVTAVAPDCFVGSDVNVPSSHATRTISPDGSTVGVAVISPRVRYPQPGAPSARFTDSRVLLSIGEPNDAMNAAPAFASTPDDGEYGSRVGDPSAGAPDRFENHSSQAAPRSSFSR